MAFVALCAVRCLLCRYNMSEDEKQTLRKYYALRWWERMGGFAGAAGSWQGRGRGRQGTQGGMT